MNATTTRTTVAALPERILEQARCQPSAPALLWHGQHVSYGDLQEMVRDAQAHLERLALPQRDPLGVLAKKSPHAISLILACLLDRRSILLPSVSLGGDTLQRLLTQAGCGQVLSPGAHPGTLNCEVVGETPTDERSRPLAAGDGALMLTTSGSTGVPKIVPLALPAIDRFIDWAGAHFGITGDTTVLNYAPLNFDLCLLDIWTTLAHGGCVALVDQDRATNAHYLVDLLTTAQPHVIQAVPMLYRLLIDATQGSGHRVTSAREVIVTGDSTPQRTLAALPALFPRARFSNIYGSTETNDSFIHEIDISRAATQPHLPIGQPIDGVSALVVDDAGHALEGPGTGELWVATPFQTSGYLATTLNDGKFVSYRGDGRYFRTGDIVRRHDDGTLTLEGRTDSFVKVRGVRISTNAVEQVILSHPQVVEVAVVAVPDEVAGHRLHAVVRREAASQLNSLGLRQHCARGLDRAAIPTTIRIVTTPLPKTPTGKIDRQRAVSNQEEKST